MKTSFLITLLVLLAFPLLHAQTDSWNPEKHKIPTTERLDHRFQSSYGAVWTMLNNTTPKFSFNPEFSQKDFLKWQKGLRNAMSEIMCFPKISNLPKPVRITSELREGYQLEKWECYPLPGCVFSYLVLIPEHLGKPVPAVLCIPGSGQSKEEIAGEQGVYPNLSPNYRNPKMTQALAYVKAGYIAVAVDNPAAGETSDLEQYTVGTNYDYDIISRYLLELGWSYLGYTSYLDMQVLEWMKKQEMIRKDRIVVSGFSLGTEPLMVLGALDPSIYAFVYNDFLCQTQERAEVMTVPNQSGRRGFPNSIRHLIPNFWKNFNFPDILAALAPRLLIITEGGLDRDFNNIQKAYEIMGCQEKLELHHQPKFANPENRKDIKNLPKGLNRNEYYEMVNVDGSNHYFKSELVIPWLEKNLK